MTYPTHRKGYIMSEKKKKRKHRFVIGYCSDGNAVYGKNHFADNAPRAGQYADPMTKHDAKRLVEKLVHPRVDARIFEMVEVEGEVNP